MNVPIRVGMLSLGCPRTLVDSERLLGRLQLHGYTITDGIDQTDVAIVNTCSFVHDAIQESVDTILDMVERKRRGQLRAVIVSGCLPQRYPMELYDELQEVDGFMGADSFGNVEDVLAAALAGKRPLAVRKRPQTSHFGLAERVGLTPRHYAYLKVSEGCLKGCAFCIIPQLKGPLQSRRIEDVVHEARQLVASGARELIVVGQDTSDYGVDLYGTPRLVELLDRLSRMEGARWVRLLYCHPWGITEELIELLRDRTTLCTYLDMAIEHSEDSVLQRMNRRMTRATLEATIARLRERVPGIALRTSVIVGFPGETDEEFARLCDFIQCVRFDRLGVFKYSREQGTAAYGMPNQVPAAIAKQRHDQLMALQQTIARDVNAERLGTETLVHIDERDPHDPRIAIGRTSADCPEVDGVTYVTGDTLSPGDFVSVRITETHEYDLVGVPTAVG